MLGFLGFVEISSMFYIIGIFFMVITVGYFVGNYLDIFPSSVKVVLAFTFSVALFIVGEILRRREK